MIKQMKSYSSMHIFFLTLALIVLMICLLIKQLPGLLVAAGLAYLFNPFLIALSKYKLDKFWGSLVVLVCLLAFGFFVILILLPFMVKQFFGFVQSWPEIMHAVELTTSQIPQVLSQYLTFAQIDQLALKLQSWLTSSSSSGVTFIFMMLPSLISFIMYVILVPILVFFFLKDSLSIKRWFVGLVPKPNDLVLSFFLAIDIQLGHYLRGKLLEIMIVAFMSFILFFSFGLKYSLILGFLVGVSVFVPLVGAIIASVFVLLVAYWQWGMGDYFYGFILSYSMVLLLDAQVLVPWLFSQKLKLHPCVVLIAVLYFGNIWGFWGVFFAIPLASIINILLNLWQTGEFLCQS